MNKQIAIVNKGFVRCYLEYLLNYCKQYGITVDIIENSKEIEKLLPLYDYILMEGTSSFKKGVCGIFHAHSILYKVSVIKNPIYRFLFKISHFHKIYLSKQTYKTMPKIFVVSSLVKKELESNYKIASDSIKVIYPGFTVSDKAQNFCRQLPDEFTIGVNCMGFVSKGGYVILNALKKLRKDYPDFKVKARIIYPKYKSNLAVRFFVWINRLGDYVEFVDKQKDMAKFYQSCHVFVCPSHLESFGRVVTEAMFYGCPVIIGSNIGASDIIQDNVNGFIFNADKWASANLAKKIAEVYNKYDNLDNVIENAHKTVKDVTWENFAKELLVTLYPETVCV